MEELIHETLLHKVPATKLSDFVGGFNYVGTLQRESRILADPSYAEIRHV